jgi:hypothetical protein
MSYYITAGLAALGSFGLSAYYHRDELTLPPPSKEEGEFAQLKRECTGESAGSIDMNRSFALMSEMDTLSKIEEIQTKAKNLNLFDFTTFFKQNSDYFFTSFPTRFQKGQLELQQSFISKAFVLQKLTEIKTDLLHHFPALLGIGDEKYQRFLHFYVSGRKKLGFEDQAKLLAHQAFSFFKKDIQVVKDKACTLATSAIAKTWETVATRCLSEDARKKTENLVGTAKWAYSLTPRSVKAVGAGFFFPGSLVKRAICGLAAYYLLP